MSHQFSPTSNDHSSGRQKVVSNGQPVGYYTGSDVAISPSNQKVVVEPHQNVILDPQRPRRVSAIIASIPTAGIHPQSVAPGSYDFPTLPVNTHVHTPIVPISPGAPTSHSIYPSSHQLSPSKSQFVPAYSPNAVTSPVSITYTCKCNYKGIQPGVPGYDDVNPFPGSRSATAYANLKTNCYCNPNSAKGRRASNAARDNASFTPRRPSVSGPAPAMVSNVPSVYGEIISPASAIWDDDELNEN